MTQALALIIDDEPDIRELLEITLSRMGVATRAAASVSEALQALTEQHFDLRLADMRLPDGNGIDIVRQVNAQHPDTPIAMITAHGNMDSAIEALKAGAFGFVSKPVELGVLRRLVETALRLKAGENPGGDHAQAADNALLGRSPAIEDLRRLTDKLARSQAPVFVSGESGTGKELAARLIHQKGPRADKAFVAVNCGAIPAELMESELFGHVKGSFTGANTDKEGLFLTADGGTLFLDEVADLPLAMQVKLLRAIQEKRIRPVGATREIEIDVRLISATHKDMNALVAEGQFRQDLFFRIHVIELRMPPLREHREDIPLLIDHILQRISHLTGQPKPRLHRDALAMLQSYDHPGNVRELENILERASALCEDDLIQAEDLGLAPAVAESGPASGTPPPARSADLEGELARLEKHMIMQALEENRWNRTAAARKLGLTLRSLRYRMQKLGLTDPD